MTEGARPPFPMHVDSSMRGSFVSCPRKFELEYMQHWKPKLPNIHLHAGGAFAHGLEIARRSYHEFGRPMETAVAEGATELIKFWGDFEDPQGTNKSRANMLGALGEYFGHYGMETDPIQPAMIDGKPAVEFSFALPIDVQHPETGDPLLYVGRFDMLGVHNNQLWVVDEKTTSQLGRTWFTQWVLRGQITGYVWAARQFGHIVAGAIIRGMAIRSRDYGHAESIQYRSDWEIERWYKQLCRDVERMKSCWQEGYFDYSLDSACSSYGGCTFLDVCTSPHPERWLEQDFERRIWDPINSSEVKVE